MTALAIPATPIMPAALAAQPGVMKIARGSMTDAVKTPDAEVMESQEPFHSLMQELSATEEEPATQLLKRDVTDVLMKAAPKAAPARAAAFHSTTRALPAAREKAKTKPAKRDANNDLAASLPAATSVKESKPPIVWALPQMSAALETTSLQAAASNPGYARTSVNNDAVRGTAGDNRQQPQPTAQAPAPPKALAQELTQDGRIASSTAAIVSEGAAQASAIEPEDSPSADPIASTVPTAPFGDATTAQVAFEARLRPIQPDPATEQEIGPEPGPVRAETVSTSLSAAPASPLDTSTAAKTWFEAHPRSIPMALAVEQKIPPETRSVHADTVSPAAIQNSAIESQDPPPADPLASTAPASRLSDAATAMAAFEARSRLILPVQAATPEIGSQPRPVKAEPSSFRQPAQETSNTPRPESVAAPAEKHNDSQRDQQERQQKGAPSVAPATPEAAPVHVEMATSAATNSMAASIAAAAPAVSSASAPASVSAPPPAQTSAAAADVAPMADPAPSPAAANDIKIALNDNGQRVELRVTERAGDIHVTVRTPDSQLATAMREDLPALSSKLEQSGLHSEMWRPAASASSENRMIETLGGNASADAREQPGGRQQREGQQQDPRNPQQTLNRKSDRKEFSWLFESMR